MCWERRERSAVDGKTGADGDHGGPIAVDSCKHGGSVLHPKGSVARDPQVTSKWWHPKGSVVVARPDGGPVSFCSFPCGDAWWTSGDTVVHDPAPHDECFRAAKRARRLPQTPQAPGGDTSMAPASPVVGILPPPDRMVPGFLIGRLFAAPLPRAPQVPGGGQVHGAALARRRPWHRQLLAVCTEEKPIRNQ